MIDMKIHKTTSIFLLTYFVFLLTSCKNNRNQDKTESPSFDSASTTRISTGSDLKSDSTAFIGKTADRNDSIDDVEGTYFVVNEPNEVEKCQLSITIIKTSEGNIYEFSTDSRLLKGKVSFDRTEDRSGYYITLEGIEWSEYEGALDEDGESNGSEKMELPVGIHGLIQDNQITIQNYGNSMNYYVQLGDCGKKYIVLKKR